MTATSGSLSASLEDYLEAIFMLIRDRAQARSSEIARRLNVKRSSVTGALRALKERGLVHYQPYGAVTLTDEGKTVAGRIARRHVALRDFMVNVLSIDAAAAEEAACRMEHGIPKRVVDRFIDFADFVQTCPRAGAQWVHGFGYRCETEAPSTERCERCIRECLEDVRRKETMKDPQQAHTTLDRLKPGEKGQIEKLGGSGAVRRRIRDMGVTGGTLVEVVRIAPLGDPIDVKIKGYHLSLRKKEAADIAVRKLDGNESPEGTNDA
jgi:DtxR family transcriptional regulator, Mn-dependent transcriptional regulator